MIYSHKTLIVLGTLMDPHVDRVVREIEKYGDIKAFIFDYNDSSKFSVRVSEKGSANIQLNGHMIPNNCLVWDRRKILPGTELYICGDDEASTGYAAQEWRAFYTLICGLYENRVVNSLESRRCMIKPYQQIIAASAGMAVPETLVTNDKKM